MSGRRWPDACSTSARASSCEPVDRNLLLAGLSACQVALAQGGPPMITDDPGTPGDSRWEVNVAATGHRDANGSLGELPLLDINYGLGETIQLKYEVPWVVLHEEGSDSRSGLGNSLLGVKWRFYDAADTGWQVSTYPQLEFRNPGSDSASRGLAENATTILLPFEFLRTFASLASTSRWAASFRRRARMPGWAARSLATRGAKGSKGWQSCTPKPPNRSIVPLFR